MRAADRYLFDSTVGGYRLNTDFGEVMLTLGRAFGFAFGHKENGAMFSHMAVMFANALYQRGLVQEGWRVLEGIYDQSQDFAISRMYPGIPEYFSDRGRGMYPWLTGSASWYLLTLVTEAFGVKGHLGDLLLQPKLLASQFDERGRAGVRTLFAGRAIEVVYHNVERLDYGSYEIKTVHIDGQAGAVELGRDGALLPRAALLSLSPDMLHRVDVGLGGQHSGAVNTGSCLLSRSAQPATTLRASWRSFFVSRDRIAHSSMRPVTAAGCPVSCSSP